MKIISYNVNGIRSAISKGLSEWLAEENPEILCLQETKAQPEQIDQLLFAELGYQSCLLHSAEKKGYSGVAIISKQTPDFYSVGIGNEQFDREGRVLRADFGELTVVCVYIPSGTMGDIRQDFKMEFLTYFTEYINKLKMERPHLLICGDFNICHKPIDINHPERHLQDSGFLPEEREWFDQFIESGLVDSFRQFDKSAEKYSWWSFRAGARVKNLGWRIDYHIVTPAVSEKLVGASILNDIKFSDHCPVVAEVAY
ncbi:MAG: exodeoxyribonuclease III [Bacteroides sp.]